MPKDAAETNISKGNSGMMNVNNDISTVTLTSGEKQFLLQGMTCIYTNNC